jgi:glucokinase
MTPVAAASGTAPHPRLLADVGGTHARLAWVARPGEALGHTASYRCAEHAGLEAVVERYLVERRLPPPRAVAIGIATPVIGDEVVMTNRAWRFSIAQLGRQWGVERLLVLNDFAALAHGLPNATADELRAVGGGAAIAGAPVAIVGPGTGLGVSGLFPSPAGPVPIAGEGGHATLAAADAREERVLGWLRDEFGHASAERALSGEGLVNLHRASCALGGTPAEELDAAAITARAMIGGDRACVDAVELFLAFLGGFAGNLALTLGARGGVYIAGGIVPRLGERIDRSSFRERFEAKGRFRPYLEAIATRVVLDAATLALRGADAALDASADRAGVAVPSPSARAP